MARRSILLLAILLPWVCPSPALASQPVELRRAVPDTTYDEPPRVLSTVAAWWREDYEGLVLVGVRIDTLGSVTQASPVLPARPSLERAVTDAARRWRFAPARRRRRPVEVPWLINIELRHPRSGELATPEDTLSVVPPVRLGRWMERRAAVSLRASVTYDSATAKYRYTYDLRNRSNNSARVVGFALLGTVTEIRPRSTYTQLAVEERGRPAHWNMHVGCGGRRDVLGWMIWELDSNGSLFGHAVKPGRSLEPMMFDSPFPPGRVRWVAETARSSKIEPASSGCASSSSAELEALPLTGWTVGPVEK